MIAARPFLLAVTRDCTWRDGAEDHPRHTDGQCSVGGQTCERAIMPRCQRLCSPTMGGGRRERTGECSRVNLSQLIIGRLLLAAVVRRLLVTSKGNDAYRLHSTL